MTLLSSGMLLWFVTHSFPMAMPGPRDAVVRRLGEGPYKGLFAVLTVVAIALIVLGWREAPIIQSYIPPLFGNWFVVAVVFIALVLMTASAIPSNLRRLVRHPQLTGVAVWALGHLLVNGSARDVVLFGGFALWAIAAIVLSNRRDGTWQRPGPTPVWRDVLVIGVAAVVTGVVLHFHGTWFGVTAIHR